jgi:hypothetical protein
VGSLGATDELIIIISIIIMRSAVNWRKTYSFTPARIDAT